MASTEAAEFCGGKGQCRNANGGARYKPRLAKFIYIKSGSHCSAQNQYLVIEARFLVAAR